MFILVVASMAIASVFSYLMSLRGESIAGLLGLVGIVTFWGVVLFNEQKIRKFFVRYFRWVRNFFPYLS